MNTIGRYLKSIIFVYLTLQGTAWPNENFIKIGTGGPTGVYFQVGNTICKMVAKLQSSNFGRSKGTEDTYFCSAPSTGGSNFNMGNIKDGKLDLGVAQSDWQYHAYNGTSKWKGHQFNNLRSVFSFHNEPFQIIASKKSKVKTFKDLKGKIVNIGNPGSGQRKMMDELINAHGLSYNFFKKVTELTSSEQFRAFCDGKIDAFGYAIGYPNGAMEQAARCRAKGRWVSLNSSVVDKLVKEKTYYSYAKIPRGTYSGQKKDIITYGVKSTVVTNKNVPNKTVYDITKAVFENLDEFKKQHPAFANLNKKMMLEGLSAPLHAGAIKWYKESLTDYPNHLYIGYAEKSKKKKKRVVKVLEESVIEQQQKEIKIKKVNKDITGPEIKIAEAITFTDSNYSLEGSVSDKGSDKIYISVDKQNYPVKKGKFKINRYSPLDEEVKIVAIDKFGNKSTKIVKVTIDVKEDLIAQKIEPLNPALSKAEISGEKVAIIIGIENYSEAPKATHANLDAKYFFDYARKAFGAKKQNIKLLINQEATFVKTNVALTKWLRSRIKSNQTDLIIFFAGHGLASNDGKELYLLTQDSDTDLLSKTALSRSELFAEIIKLKPKSVTMFLDTCYSGVSRDEQMLLASARPIRVTVSDQKVVPDNFTIFSATKLNQISSGLSGAKHGIFSYYLMKGLEGKADSNNDKKLTNRELMTYMDENVSRKAAEIGRVQNPSFLGNADKILIKY